MDKPSTQKESWEEKFDERFTDNPVFWSELVAEWHQGDVDVKPFKRFIQSATLSAVRENTERLIQRLEKEKRIDPKWPNDADDAEFNGGVDCAIQIIREDDL